MNSHSSPLFDPGPMPRALSLDESLFVLDFFLRNTEKAFQFWEAEKNHSAATICARLAFKIWGPKCSQIKWEFLIQGDPNPIRVAVASVRDKLHNLEYEISLNQKAPWKPEVEVQKPVDALELIEQQRAELFFRLSDAPQLKASIDKSLQGFSESQHSEQNSCNELIQSIRNNISGQPYFLFEYLWETVGQYVSFSSISDDAERLGFRNAHPSNEAINGALRRLRKQLIDYPVDIEISMQTWRCKMILD
ncbi:hypothetical protein OAE80_01935 [Planctomycetaceae bacterium]|nr:hypothetical protein [Planctomycetaceae bacterium]